MKSMGYAIRWKAVETGGAIPGEVVERWPPLIRPPLPPPDALPVSFSVGADKSSDCEKGSGSPEQIPQHPVFCGAPT